MKTSSECGENLDTMLYTVTEILGSQSHVVPDNHFCAKIPFDSICKLFYVSIFFGFYLIVMFVYLIGSNWVEIFFSAKLSVNREYQSSEKNKDSLHHWSFHKLS